MKKLLAVLLASALFVPAMAGSIFNNVETTGEIQTIGSMYRNNTGSYRDVSSRLLFGMGMDLVEDVKANVTFLSSNYWGTDADQASVGDYWDRIKVAEAYVTLSNVFNAFEVKVGRQFYGDEKSAVMYYGPTHYRPNIATTAPAFVGPAPVPPATPAVFGSTDSQSIDAAVLSYTSDSALFNIVYAKLLENNFGTYDAAGNYVPGYDGDVDATLLGADLKYFVNNNLFVQGYIYDYRNGLVDDGAGNITVEKNYHFGIYGGKLGYSDDAMNVGVEYARNYEGEQYFQKNDGWMLKADAAMAVTTDAMDLTPRLTYVHSEQDFESNGNYAPGIYFGYNNIFDGSNNRILNAGVDFKFASLSKFNFAFDYYAFKSGIEDNPEWVGNEFDLMAKYGLNEYVELHAGVGYVTNYDEGTSGDTAYAGQLGMIVKF